MNELEILKKKRKFTNVLANVNFGFLLYQGVVILALAQAKQPIPPDMGVGAVATFGIFWFMKSEIEKFDKRIVELEGKNGGKGL